MNERLFLGFLNCHCLFDTSEQDKFTPFMNDVNLLCRNDEVWHHQIIIFVKVINDACLYPPSGPQNDRKVTKGKS